MKTKAAILTRLAEPLVVEEIEVPPLARGQVLVKMLAAGLCRTQLAEARGLKGPDLYLPHLLGHEGAGIVEEVGAQVATVAAGDYVVVSWLKGQGLNVPGGTYGWDQRQVNAGGAAVFSEYAVVSENRVTAIDPKIPAEVVALLGCAIATGVGAVREAVAEDSNPRLGIFGIGGIGGAAILGAKALNVSHIAAVDVTEEKLEFARTLGAHEIFHSPKHMPSNLDIAIDTSGVPGAIEQAFQSLASGGTLVIAGHPPHGSSVRFDPFAFIEGRRVRGTWGGGCVPERDFPLYGQWYMAGRLPIDRLITHRYELADINQALNDLEHGILGRAIIRIADYE